MPRGRLSLKASATPVPKSSETGNGPASAPERLTRTRSARNLRGSSAADELQSQEITPARTLRGRSRLIATLAQDDDTMTSESISSVPTPFGQTSESGYSTPGTSKLPSPAEAATIPNGKTSSAFEVQIPARSRLQGPGGDERALRRSIYSLNAKSKKVTEVQDSDEEDDDFAAITRDEKVARRLQNEFHMESLRSRRTEATDAQSSFSTEASGKRPRSLSGPTATHKRLSKKSKTIPDSDDLSEADVDMDAEIAAGLALEDDQSNGEALSLGEETEDEGEEDVEDDVEEDVEDDVEEDVDEDIDEDVEDEIAASTDDEPLAVQRKKKKPARVYAKRAAATRTSTKLADAPTAAIADSESGMSALPSDFSSGLSSGISSAATSDSESSAVRQPPSSELRSIASRRRAFRRAKNKSRVAKERDRLEKHHPELTTMWTDLESMPVMKAGKIDQPASISRLLKPFQLEGVAWMKAMETTKWKGGLLGDEMGLGKTIQAVSLIMSDYPAKQPTLVLVPPVALMQWQSEIKSYTDGTLKTFVFHGTNQKAKNITVKELKKFDVIMMSYNSLESMYRKQEKGFKRKDGIYKEKSVIHAITFHRAILDEAHCIKTRTTMTAKACFALKTVYRWCLSGTPLQNRIGELFSLVRFLNITPFASYLCKQCPCSTLEWSMDENSRCSDCGHAGMQHVSVFNQELLNPIQKFGNLGPGREAFKKLRLMTDRIMLRRLKKDHTNSMELPVKERRFDTYVAQGVLLNNYANIFGLIMQMRQVADHPDLILKKNADGGQNVLVCCICDEPAEDTIKSRCKHDFCRACVSSYIKSTDEPDCPRCHIALVIDLEQPEIEQDEVLVKKSSIINRIKMENWTSSSKIELLVHELHKLRSDNATHKSIIFSQFTTMLQLIEWRLRRAGITTVMLDGSMTPAQRQASIEHFMNNIDVECFLVSLKAGGVALNLTEASRVFIVDPWWNPAAEWQSADRCHRIGQQRPCVITRLCIEDSVESRMVLIQEKKTSMIHSTVNADDKAMDTLSPEDMQFLFRGS
ncbi:type III restriction enzyme, res subunit domain-containing protein [Trichoderma breve]|uniref:Type III restriction enzyme, res subunit domain-containing protein n=1 Tax=Trichoderma breve TaxID=2034170 RepID=A0A9W9JQC2_9HYPO|nr:type III restriction enzyme, res subunit domain-containing protein [Trichoderma breve]KAJ4863983.1 type III restriction enzyme, res subunit domain-containing protein [Trichoderma breve]